MKLIYFVQYFPPEKASGLSLVTELLQGFAQCGWEIDVYTPMPTRGVTSEVRKEYKARRLEQLYNGKLRIHRMPLYNEKKSFVQRTIRYCIFSMQCLVKGLFCPADMIFTGGGPPTQGIVAGLIRKWTKKKVIYNPQDLFPDSLIYAGMTTEKSAFVRLWRVFERFSYNHADAVITISDEMKRTILSRCKHPERVHVVRNWIDTEVIQPVGRENNRLFDELSLPRDRFYVTYAGNLGAMQGVEVIVEAAALLKDYMHIQFVIFGNGSEEEKISRYIRNRGLKNISLFPLQSPQRISEVYSLGDVSIVSCKAGTSKVGMPSKIWSILATGTGILASFDKGSELDQLLNENDCGCCVEPNDPKALAAAVLKLSECPETVKRFGAHARKYAVESCSRESNVNQYIKLMKECFD